MVHTATREAGISKLASCHIIQHSFAVHLSGAGYDNRTVRELLVQMGRTSPSAPLSRHETSR